VPSKFLSATKNLLLPPPPPKLKPPPSSLTSPRPTRSASAFLSLPQSFSCSLSLSHLFLLPSPWLLERCANSAPALLALARSRNYRQSGWERGEKWGDVLRCFHSTHLIPKRRVVGRSSERGHGVSATTAATATPAAGPAAASATPFFCFLLPGDPPGHLPAVNHVANCVSARDREMKRALMRPPPCARRCVPRGSPFSDRESAHAPIPPRRRPIEPARGGCDGGGDGGEQLIVCSSLPQSLRHCLRHKNVLLIPFGKAKTMLLAINCWSPPLQTRRKCGPAFLLGRFVRREKAKEASTVLVG